MHEMPREWDAADRRARLCTATVRALHDPSSPVTSLPSRLAYFFQSKLGASYPAGRVLDLKSEWRGVSVETYLL